MTRILFICHGNICRSPMAEFVMRDMVEKAGRSSEFFIASAATSSEELGNGDPEDKLRLLLDYTGRPRDVADPWYTGDFDATWRDVTEGCRALLAAFDRGQA